MSGLDGKENRNTWWLYGGRSGEGILARRLIACRLRHFDRSQTDRGAKAQVVGYLAGDLERRRQQSYLMMLVAARHVGWCEVWLKGPARKRKYRLFCLRHADVEQGRNAENKKAAAFGGGVVSRRRKAVASEGGRLVEKRLVRRES